MNAPVGAENLDAVAGGELLHDLIRAPEIGAKAIAPVATLRHLVGEDVAMGAGGVEPLRQAAAEIAALRFVRVSLSPVMSYSFGVSSVEARPPVDLLGRAHHARPLLERDAFAKPRRAVVAPAVGVAVIEAVRIGLADRAAADSGAALGAMARPPLRVAQLRFRRHLGFVAGIAARVRGIVLCCDRQLQRRLHRLRPVDFRVRLHQAHELRADRFGAAVPQLLATIADQLLDGRVVPDFLDPRLQRFTHNRGRPSLHFRSGARLAMRPARVWCSGR